MKNLNLLIFFTIILYIATIIFVLKWINYFRCKCKPFPKLKLVKSGIEFFSYNQHRIQIQDAKVIELDNSIYITKDNHQIIITNAKQQFIKQGFLYIKAQGKVNISMSLGLIYKYLNIHIQSPNFSLSGLKQNAIKNIVSFPFQIGVDLKKYLSFIKNILKINITKNQITVSQNKYKLKYVLIYKNNGYKKIYINKTLWN